MISIVRQRSVIICSENRGQALSSQSRQEFRSFCSILGVAAPSLTGLRATRGEDAQKTKTPETRVSGVFMAVNSHGSLDRHRPSQPLDLGAGSPRCLCPCGCSGDGVAEFPRRSHPFGGSLERLSFGFPLDSAFPVPPLDQGSGFPQRINLPVWPAMGSSSCPDALILKSGSVSEASGFPSAWLLPFRPRCGARVAPIAASSGSPTVGLSGFPEVSTFRLCSRALSPGCPGSITLGSPRGVSKFP